MNQINMNQINMNQIDDQTRDIGKAALSSILTIQKNIDILERNIYQNTETIDQYQELCMYIVTQIQAGSKLNDLLSMIKKKKFGFNSNYFEDVRASLDEQQNFIENPFEVDEGVLECKCGSRKTISFSKQIRSGDEGTTVFAKCVTCGKTWKT